MIKKILCTFSRLFLYALGLSTLMLGSFFAYMLYMPQDSWQHALLPLSENEQQLVLNTQAHVQALCHNAKGRSYLEKDSLDQARDYIAAQFKAYGYKVNYQHYTLYHEQYSNIIVEKKGSTTHQETIIIGAHYDTEGLSMGANDNASGVAALLEIARLMQHIDTDFHVRFVAFTNEEPPHFQTENMGSWRYAQHVHQQKETIVAMFSLESLGYYSDQAHSQKYPSPFHYFFPDKANFIAFVGNLDSSSLVRDSIQSFRTHGKFPSEGLAAPSVISGVAWSDQWAFWLHDYPALMVTDTAPFRYEAYHTSRDTPEKIDYNKMARVISGFIHVIKDMASPS